MRRQRIVSGPALELAETMKSVSEEEDCTGCPAVQRRDKFEASTKANPVAGSASFVAARESEHLRAKLPRKAA